jgi:hypothetical protein
MRNLEMKDLQELNQEELKEIDGGGWLADAVAAVVGIVKCSCHSPSGEYHDTMSRSNYGGIR